MSVTNGQPANQTVFNNAFISRTGTTTVTGLITLDNDVSGDTVTNLQTAVNSGRVTEYAEQTIGPGGTIDSAEKVGSQLRLIKSSGGEVALSGQIFGDKSFSGGISITLIGTNDTDYIKLENPVLDNTAEYALLNGSIELKKYTSITFRYSTGLSRWIETSRNL